MAACHDFGKRGCYSRVVTQGIAEQSSIAHAASDIAGQATEDQHGFVEVHTQCGKRGSGDRGRTPLVRGPPGAFYQGLRSASDRRRDNWTFDRKHLAKNPSHHATSSDYPTNTLRPLSLLAGRRPSTPLDPCMTPKDERQHGKYVYRSPLAPPKRTSWRKLYTKSQLLCFQEAAKADGFYKSQNSLPQTTGLSIDPPISDGSSQRELRGSPQLSTWRQFSSIRTDLAPRRKRVSIIVLCLCNLFPPLLCLYALSWLDGIMVWLTNGECSTFGRGEMRCAFILMCLWSLAAFAGTVAGLVYMLSSH